MFTGVCSVFVDVCRWCLLTGAYRCLPVFGVLIGVCIAAYRCL